ncbi:hypothetical protein XENOCAPTIV_008421 [Xenoophorus captivus]|uniref:Uncharacterized protein n=1 Tax=Xenoophorus captivus TaxID=1517983 RepID=A0ABV0R8W5_9TELE
MSSTSSLSSIQAEADQGSAQTINESSTTRENVSTYPKDFPEVHMSASTAQTLSSTEAVQHNYKSSSMPHFSSTASSVMLSGNVVQTTQSLSNGERSSIYPSSAFASSPLCDLSVFSNTPPIKTVVELAHTSVAAELSKSSLDFSSSTLSLSFSPTLQPSVLFSSEFTFSGVTMGLSKSATTGFEDSMYATGSTTESLVPEISSDGLLLASDVDIVCGCSLETSTTSSWLHASPHVPLPSSAKSSTSLELYSSMILLSASGVVIENLPTSLEGLGSPGVSFDHSLQSYSANSLSSSQFLQAAHSDLHLSVTATLSVGTDSGLSASERSTNFQTSSLPFPLNTSLFTPTPEEQVIDFSSSTSGSAFFTDSQEGVDQEWDKGQNSAFGVSQLPHSAKVVSTVPPFMTLESGQGPDEVEEHSSAFYFESGSGSAFHPEVGGKAEPTVSEETSGLPWSLGGTDISGSGQGEGLSDNETSSDFSISEHPEIESEEEEPVAGKSKQADAEK